MAVYLLHGLPFSWTGDQCPLVRICRYRMDYMKFVEHHRATDADITIGVLPVDRSKASEFGVMKIDDEGRIQVLMLVLVAVPL